MSFESIRRLPKLLPWPSRSPSDKRHRLGLQGERAAARFLKKHRHSLVTRNFSCAAGELDLVTVHGDTIVFVEVKTRTSEDAQLLQDAVRKIQWGRIERAADYFIRQRRAWNLPCRFDLVTVLWNLRRRPTIEHFVDAHQSATSLSGSPAKQWA